MKPRPQLALTVIVTLALSGGFAWAAHSLRPGMGATPYADAGGSGVTFRVWSPNSSSVSVPGDFNGWDVLAHPLTKEAGTDIWSTDVPGATHGQKYKYFLNGFDWEKDPRARHSTFTHVDPYGADSIVYDPNAFDWGGVQSPTPWQNDLVIYEMHVGTFHDPDPFDGYAGNFYNAIDRLDHLAALGVNAVELMPIAEFRGDRSWGYNPADIYAVENGGYGGPDGLKSFVKAAHSRGIAVFLDQVHNHYGPDEMDMWDFDDNWGPGIYFYPGDYPSIGATPWGQRPNYSTDGVRSFIIDNFRMWMDEYHIDGFRWDSVGSMRRYDAGGDVYNPIPDGDSLISYINNTLINNDHPWVISIAEDDSSGMGFDGEWAHGFKDTLVDVVTQPADGSRDMNALAAAIDGSGHYRVLFDETHDTVAPDNGGARLPVRIDGAYPDSDYARKRSTLAAAVVLSAPGVPMLFMGQEMLEDQGFSAWDALDWNHTDYFPGIVRMYRDLIHLRRNLDGVSLGLTGPDLTWHQVNDTAKVLAYHRHGAGADDQVMVVLNFSATTFPSYWINTFPADGNWFVNLNSDWAEYGFGGYGSKLVNVSGGSGELQIAPYSFLILSRQPRPDVDHDSDGMTSGEEKVADTLPWDPGSVLRVHQVERAGGGVDVHWHGGQGATQVLSRAAASTSPAWEQVFTNPPPTAVSNNWADAGAVSNAVLYRVEAVPAD